MKTRSNKDKKRNKKQFLLSVMSFKKRDIWKKYAKDYLILIFAAFLFTVSYDYFISATTQYGIFPSGIGALSRIFAIYTSNAISSQNFYYFIYLFLLNLPLFIFSLVKLSIRFSIKTIIFISLQLFFNFILTSIPAISPQNFHILVDYGTLSHETINYQLWLFVFAILGGITYGYAAGLTYYVSSSTGGTDFLSMYYSIKKKKSIGNINKYINISILILVIVMTALHISNAEYKEIYPNDNLSRNEYIIKFIFGPSLFASLLFILIQSAVINNTYPKYEFRTLFIITKKSDLVIKSMRKTGTVLNDISVWDAINTQLDERQDTKGYKIIMSTITLVEYRKVKYSIMKSDPHARVFLQRVDRIAGTYQIRNNI